MENPEIPGRIQMERFIPVEIFRKKGNTFRGMSFFPFLPKRPKFSVPFVWITSARLKVERKRKIHRYFVNGTTQFRSCFRYQKKIPVPCDENFSSKFPYKSNWCEAILNNYGVKCKFGRVYWLTRMRSSQK